MSGQGLDVAGQPDKEDAQNELQQQIAAQRRRETWETATVQVFNDGRQTFIRLSAAVNRSDVAAWVS